MNYKKYILTKLINRYEKSVLSKNGSDRNIKISLKFDIKNMKDYCSEDSYKYIDEINKSVDELESINYITVGRKGNRINKVFLNLDEISNIYEYCGIKSKKNVNDEYLSIIDKYSTNHDTNIFKEYIVDRLNNYKSISKYFENSLELMDIMKTLANLGNSASIRNFSAKYLGDSKKLENLEVRFNNIIKDIFKSNLTFYEYLESYNIYKNPTCVYMRGRGVFLINDTVIDLDLFGNELILSSNQINNLKVLKVDSVVTVENLTTYNDIDTNNNLVIYLGGYHNTIKSIILKKIYEYDNSIKFIHIGDIDAGGFYILNHLIEDTGINFNTYKMDINTLKEYLPYCKSLTNNDIDRLNNLKCIMPKYIDIFNYMLDNNIKLEQENISYFE